MLMRSFVLFLLLGLPVMTLAAQPCLLQVESQANSLAPLRRQLAAAQISEEERYLVPAEMRGKISQLKQALAKTADAAMRCQGRDANPKSLQSELDGLLRASQPKSASESDFFYGAHLRFRVERPNGTSQLIAIMASFEIGCGYDEMLLVYAFDSNGWKRKLRWQSAPYDEVKGAFGDFFKYVFVSADRTPGWRIVAAHGTPWCTSRWSKFAVDVLEPTSDEDKPAVLWHKENGYTRFLPEPTLKAVGGGFELRVEGATIEAEMMTRAHIYRYERADRTMRRVQPVAVNVRDFVDEWIQSRWDEAANWTSRNAIAKLKELHEKLSPSQESAKTALAFSYGPVRSCSDGARHLQVEIDAEAGSEQRFATFFQVETRQNGFMTLFSADSHADARCAGADLSKSWPR
ncbi:MAG: hypothetical protein J0I77_07365 [Rudaea sp.]|uniref:hypothetical protein n=1 Tax=unclassified Rudaea TaxID=2627037 RepID=UPI0010F65A21|nr:MULTISPECIES: hypothetical protein [unclassified Rudaea]MBN8885522.1 hypothetical protein [Rudaea sp.]MBR0346497.1 hypothetical protein [Rudaea sp.]